MEYTILGRTGLKVSVMGLGCGGPSRIGQRTGRSIDDSVAIIKQALNSGINFKQSPVTDVSSKEDFGFSLILGNCFHYAVITGQGNCTQSNCA